MVTLAEHRQLYAVDGHLTINAYLRATLNCSSTEASRLRTTAKAVDNIDGLGDAWLNGRFGISQVARFAKTYSNTRVRDRLPPPPNEEGQTLRVRPIRGRLLAYRDTKSLTLLVASVTAERRDSSNKILRFLWWPDPVLSAR